MELVGSLCRELDLIPVGDPFHTPIAATGNLRYFRLHGITGARHRFSDAELRQLEEMCRGRTLVYCLFNNLGMVRDAQRFLGMVRGT